LSPGGAAEARGGRELERPPSASERLACRANRYNSATIRVDPDAPGISSTPTAIGKGFTAAIDRDNPIESATRRDPSALSTADAAATHDDAGSPPRRCVIITIVEITESTFTVTHSFAVPASVVCDLTFSSALSLHVSGFLFISLLTFRALLAHLATRLVLARLTWLPLSHLLRLVVA